MTPPTKEQLASRLVALEGQFRACYWLVEEVTRYDAGAFIPAIALVDWWARKRKEPLTCVLEYLSSSDVVTTLERAHSLFEQAIKDEKAPPVLALSVIDNRYIMMSGAQSFDLKNNCRVDYLGQDHITVTAVNLSTLLYHLYASVAKENNEPVPHVFAKNPQQ